MTETDAGKSISFFCLSCGFQAWLRSTDGRINAGDHEEAWTFCTKCVGVIFLGFFSKTIASAKDHWDILGEEYVQGLCDRGLTSHEADG